MKTEESSNQTNFYCDETFQSTSWGGTNYSRLQSQASFRIRGVGKRNKF